MATFADQAVIAIENARLFQELGESTEIGPSVEELRALGEVSQAVGSRLDLGAVLSTILPRSVVLSGSAVARSTSTTARQVFPLRAAGGHEALTGEIGARLTPRTRR